MECYVINLERSTERRDYMQGLLQPYICLQPCQFVTAVEGGALSEDDISRQFNQERAYHRYGRELKRSEIGCTLSHRKCYRNLLASEAPCALIMEDDILFRVKPEDMASTLSTLLPELNSSRPTIILLFGEYWWTSSEDMGNVTLKRVYDAISAQGYLINRAAAGLLTSNEPSALADDWDFIISRGIRVMALHPHIIDQEWSSFETTISMDGYASYVRSNLSFATLLRLYWRGAIKRFLKAIKHFDPHIIPKEEPEWAVRLGL